MAKLIIDNITYEVPDGQPIADISQEAGIPFSCNTGVCGTCQIDIQEGAENLNELNREEQELAMDPTHRLSCQCKILGGTVKVTY